MTFDLCVSKDFINHIRISGVMLDHWTHTHTHACVLRCQLTLLLSLSLHAVTFDLPDSLFFSGFREQLAMARLQRDVARCHSEGTMVSGPGWGSCVRTQQPLPSTLSCDPATGSQRWRLHLTTFPK